MAPITQWPAAHNTCAQKTHVDNSYQNLSKIIMASTNQAVTKAEVIYKNRPVFPK